MTNYSIVVSSVLSGSVYWNITKTPNYVFVTQDSCWTHFVDQHSKKLPINTQKLIEQRMHSSRLHTGRSLTICWSLLPRGGVSAPRGVCSRGVSAPWGGVCSRGCLLRGGCISQHALRQTPLPPVDRHTLVKILPWPNFVAAGNSQLFGIYSNKARSKAKISVSIFLWCFERSFRDQREQWYVCNFPVETETVSWCLPKVFKIQNRDVVKFWKLVAHPGQ